MKRQISDKIFLDSNIILYSLGDDTPQKSKISRELLLLNPYISPQIIFECMNVCRKKLKHSIIQILDFAKDLLNICNLVEENENTVKTAFRMFENYSLQIFDSKIVATALVSDCNILYSEDMQDGMIIESKLTFPTFTLSHFPLIPSL